MRTHAHSCAHPAVARFYTYFDKTLPGQVDHVHVVMDTRELSRNARAQVRI